jgi:hypothetical protein
VTVIQRTSSLALVLLTGLSSAATAEAEANTHDGFYMGMNLGLGYYSMSVGEGVGEGSFSGLAVPTVSLALGGTLFQHLVIGGGIMFDYVPSPGIESGGMDVDFDVTQFLIGLGLYLDFYLDPAGGLHFPLFIGFGGVETSTEAGGVGGSDPVGVMSYLGVGYDMFISDNWSVGVLGRFGLGFLSQNDVSATVIEPALLGTISWH